MTQTLTNLENKMDQAFDSGDNVNGLELLRLYAAEKKADAATQYRLAVVEEQIGTQDNARVAYQNCLSLAPGNAIFHLYAGYFFQQINDSETALKLFYLCFELDEAVLYYWQNKRAQEETRLRSKAASIILRAHFSKLHRKSISDKKGTKNVYNAIWTRTHDKKYSFGHPRQKPQLFYVPSLAATPIYEPKNIEWASELEKSAASIKEEFLKALPNIRNNTRPYLSENSNLNKDFTGLTGSMNWSALDLFKNGKANNTVLKNFKLTLSLLEKTPLYSLYDKPYEIFFSILKPHQHIKTHYGLSNHSLTVHLPIVIPENCQLRVADQWRSWEEGKLIVFDDSFDHEAMNNSDQERVVLIFSVWHPGLTEIEKEVILKSFRSRQKWIEGAKTQFSASTF